jgi:hypothetical protein
LRSMLRHIVRFLLPCRLGLPPNPPIASSPTRRLVLVQESRPPQPTPLRAPTNGQQSPSDYRLTHRRLNAAAPVAANPSTLSRTRRPLPRSAHAFQDYAFLSGLRSIACRARRDALGFRLGSPMISARTNIRLPTRAMPIASKSIISSGLRA